MYCGSPSATESADRNGTLGSKHLSRRTVYREHQGGGFDFRRSAQRCQEGMFTLRDRNHAPEPVDSVHL